LTIRKIAAETAEANSERRGFSSASPTMPAGIVPITSSQPRRASTSSWRTSRIRNERSSPLTIRIQSFRKKTNSTSAVPRWVATRKVRKNRSFWWMCQPNSRGSTTP